MIDVSKLQLLSNASSNKVFASGTGSFVVAGLPGAGESIATTTIPHTYGSNNLIFQVSTTPGTTSAEVSTIPWGSGDNRTFIYAYLDAGNLYITCNINDTVGFGFPSATIYYSYKLLIP